MAEKENLDLAVATLNVFNGLSSRTVAGLRNGTHRSGKVSVWPDDLTKLLQAVDAAYPGIVDRFAAAHKEDEERRRQNG